MVIGGTLSVYSPINGKTIKASAYNIKGVQSGKTGRRLAVSGPLFLSLSDRVSIPFVLCCEISFVKGKARQETRTIRRHWCEEVRCDDKGIYSTDLGKAVVRETGAMEDTYDRTTDR